MSRTHTLGDDNCSLPSLASTGRLKVIFLRAISNGTSEDSIRMAMMMMIHIFFLFRGGQPQLTMSRRRRVIVDFSVRVQQRRLHHNGIECGRVLALPAFA